jgi:asparagine synthase (glutamine-hydrolysing)
MCGIAGVVRRTVQLAERHENTTEIYLRRATKTMLHALVHRGPDGTGIHATPEFAIGCARLQLIGCSAGLQPIVSADRRMLLVCNGEIYSPTTPSPTSPSDCAHILDVYARDGMAGFVKLRGQFAFALLDFHKNCLILARDRYGILPLYFAERNRYVWFASEIKSILMAGVLTLAEMGLDARGVLQSAVLYGPTAPRTCVLGIKQVPPGYFATWSLTGEAMRLERFTDPDSEMLSSKCPEPSRSPEVARKVFASALRTAVERRLHGEGGVAAYLSGGIDSSSILALAATVARDQLVSFSLEFVTPEIDESYAQLSVASALGVRRHALRIDLRDILDYLPQVISHTEVPITRIGPIPLFLLSRFVKQHDFKFAISGEGADELLLGYPYFRRGLTGVATKLDMWRSRIPSILSDDVRMQAAWLDVAADAQAHMQLVNNCSKRALRKADLDTKLSRYLLASQGERVAYANSIELRYPFLDEDLWSIVDDTALAGMSDKELLRSVMSKLLPKSVVERSKRGYLAPVSVPLHAVIPDATSPFWEHVSANECERYGLFDARAVSALSVRARSGTVANSETEWLQSALLLVASTHIFVRHLSNWVQGASHARQSVSSDVQLYDS